MSPEVDNDTLARKTAYAIGVTQSEFTISGQSREGETTYYTATTKAGKLYSCFVTKTHDPMRTTTMTNWVISDAKCTQMKGNKPVAK